MLGISWRRWRWLDDGVLPLSASVTYAAWAHPVFALYLRDPSTGAPHPGYSFWLCLGTVLAAFALGRIASQVRRGTALVVVGGLVAIGITLSSTAIAWVTGPPPRSWDSLPWGLTAIAAGSALLLWWRGVRMAYADHHEETARTFFVGTFALAVLILIGEVQRGSAALRRVGYGVWLLLLLAVLAVGLMLLWFSFFTRVDRRRITSGGEVVLATALALLTGTLPQPPSPEALSGPILLFVFSGLIARSLLGLSSVINNQRGRHGLRLRVDAAWLVVMLVVVLVIVSLGLGVGQVLTPDAVRGALRSLRVLWAPLVALLAFVALTVVWVIARAVAFLFSLLGLPPPEGADEPPPDAEEALDWGANLSPLARRGIEALVVLVVIAVVAWVLYRVARRLRPLGAAPRDTTERRRSVFSFDLLGKQARGFLRRRRRRRDPLVPLDATSAARRAVRLAYRRVLRRAIAVGTLREPHQSPRAYADSLSKSRPDESRSLEALAAAYESARYGAVAPSDDQVRSAEDAARRIDAALSGER